MSRIAPVEKPKNLMSRIAYTMLRRQFGKVITPAKVIYARYPSMFMWIKKMADIEQNDIQLDAEIKLLIKYYIAWLNGCAFCLDIGEKLAGQRKVNTDKFFALAELDTNPLYSDRERAALQYAKACNEKDVPDACFDAVAAHFSDKEIIGIAYIVATESYYNIMNHAIGIESDQLCSIQ